MGNLLMAGRKAEGNKDIRYIILNFKAEGASNDRLKVILSKGKEYENRCNTKGFSGNRGNRNMIKACELLLADLSRYPAKI